MSVSTLWSSIEDYLQAESIELDDLTWHGRVLKVIVDAEGGVDIDRIADISRGIARVLDDDPSLADSYTLEVSSPGLERVLRLPGHYRKSIGREVVVATSEPVDGETRHRGTLRAYDDATTTVEIDGAERLVPNELVASARTIFTWKSGAKPGKSSTKKKQVS